MHVMYVAGVMSGTSLDGIDVALVHIEGSGVGSKVELIHFTTVSFSNDIKNEIQQALSIENSNVQLICSLNFKLGLCFADAVKEVCKETNFPLGQLDLIGSHGQTIYHQPQEDGSMIPSTLQIGEPAVIAYETKTTVISNFRTMDMAAGGQGAPLVPYSEIILYRHQTKNRLLQNIGGIGNVTAIPSKLSEKSVIAFDTGPGNMIMDEVCQRLFQLLYDQNGKIAKQGVVVEEVLTYCMNHPFLKMSPPKSTGREQFGEEFVSELLKRFEKHSKENILTTVTMFTASSIVHHYKEFILPYYEIDEVILGGGGSYNDTLVEMIRYGLKEEKCALFLQEDIGYSSEAKEAIAFAILANETYHRNPSNVPSATGAKQSVVLGNITFPLISRE
ncbi:MULTISPECIES: anhydro-N-acetylmuramic acid kinase AnmK [Bacillus cereus group]|uniref:anhydro-N-acetylmuramic acid kinase AnmK n=1 Tax=Bacillus cereus group TaxID=86661 RepID=UPI0022E5D019|nr:MULTISPECIES: anhydro-N-acetylmuramic acid kinase AnmK [Bacillus cereus group]MDA2026053.1 anhydro-N-acetylmuramic acid kinase AnmK [Bacillus cereus group sp. Bcc03]MDA2215829.1 anhydro-N-acetylmuramic acid kinase AnmK [Bacillus cereus group sp. Bc228]MDA2225794.1 anhydro-N-acetylmuramic acid kinase AnmK [Bacillus cereus group sp. Bc227]MDA2712493.1 anhydro-N-acetylmuramic acid kinase AnmK [Bacillus cereus group sp. Bc025]WJE73112.1 anhydro-N-acetylmuramic acid kinase AnmK [Bacillus albus]